MAENSEERHPLFEILPRLAGLGWTLGDIMVGELMPVNGIRHIRISTDFDSADFMCVKDICEVASGTLEWTKRVARTPAHIEMDILRCRALVVALKSYCRTTGLPANAILSVEWRQYDREWDFDEDYGHEYTESELAERSLDGSLYSVSIGPQVSVGGGDMTEWFFEVQPSFIILSSRYKTH